jgi:hypothetical protein
MRFLTPHVTDSPLRPPLRSATIDLARVLRCASMLISCLLSNPSRKRPTVRSNSTRISAHFLFRLANDLPAVDFEYKLARLADDDEIRRRFAERIEKSLRFYKSVIEQERKPSDI